jgi:hypothetical protein
MPVLLSAVQVRRHLITHDAQPMYLLLTLSILKVQYTQDTLTEPVSPVILSKHVSLMLVSPPFSSIIDCAVCTAAVAKDTSTRKLATIT